MTQPAPASQGRRISARIAPRRPRLTVALTGALLVLLTGCTNSAPIGKWTGLREPAATTAAPWSYGPAQGETLESEHYRLYSTIPNANARQQLIQLLESALLAYRATTPGVVEARQAEAASEPGAARKMDCYVFADRAQWMDFTRRKTGADARIYLQITRGGYTIGEWFVAYLTAERDTWSVTAHEGFHQYCARYFKGRLPPCLEEGLATTFENVHWEQVGDRKLPRLNPMVNPVRAQGLRTILETTRRKDGTGAGFALEELIRMHAGQVVSASNTQIEAFYCQSWAFARFLQEYNNGQYRPAFHQWCLDTATGTVFDPTGTHRRAQPYWDPNAVQPILEHYTNTKLPDLQKQFDEWCHYLAYEEFAKQWQTE
jgi:hypothetical protein